MAAHVRDAWWDAFFARANTLSVLMNRLIIGINSLLGSRERPLSLASVSP
jgi:hypothetical protein